MISKESKVQTERDRVNGGASPIKGHSAKELPWVMEQLFLTTDLPLHTEDCSLERLPFTNCGLF